ncbi:MAG: PKD domain-containing protein [Flavobacteriales bacterium]
MNKKHLLSALACVAAIGAASAQEYLITQGSISACQGAFLDSGASPGPYGNNENFTAVICPDGGGPAISLQWVVFDLSTAGIAPIDQISIYDGNSTSAPLIGQGTGTNSPGIVSASFSNPTGCLTVVFTSNNTGTGNFAANITCFQPCQPPTAAATFGSPVPLLACQGEVITFDATASSAAPGFNVVQYAWDFADGTTGSGPIVQHAFTQPGEYVVQVEVTDDNNCSSTNLVDLQVLVSTTPIFTGTTPSLTICQGEAVQVESSPTAVTWSALPESNLGGGIPLPDLQGVPFNTSITFTNFAPGQTLNSTDGILSVCTSMEHSFMGDLVISLTCPNGQSIVFHQQGGGSTYIGGANDTDQSANPVLGTCWDYCWSPTATLGTFANCSTNGPTPNVMPGGTPQANALIPGTYSAVQSWGNLIGCPLNGTWTFTVTDLWAIDNGFICDWSINFDPALFPSLTTYTPVLGTTADSAGWSGPNLIPDASNPWQAVIEGVTPGTFNYTFSVTDNFGCTYDTTITVTVTPSPQGPIVIGGNPVVCSGGLATLIGPAGYDTYVWQPGGLFGPSVQVGPGTYTLTVAYGDCPLTSAPIAVTEAQVPAPEITGPPFSCGGGLAVLSTTQPYAQYSWSNQETTPSITVGSGTYTVTVTSAEGCTGTSAPYTVLVADNPIAAFSTTPASPQPMGTEVQFTDLSNGQGSAITSWQWTFGSTGEGSSAQSPAFTFNDPGLYDVALVVTNAYGCTDTVVARFEIFPPDITIPNVITPNGDQSNDYFAIENIQYWGNELAIYNRWGQVVYEASNYRNTWKADELPDGTYYYVLKLHDKKEYTGHVTVLR